MNNYMIIKLKNNCQYAIIDVLNYNDKKYFLVCKIIGDTIEKIYTICEYNEQNNCFDKVGNQDELEILFEDKLKSKRKVLSYFDELKKEMTKLKVLDINSNLYLLKDDFGNLIKKNILFINDVPNIGSNLYLTKNIIKEENIFTYGDIYNSNSTNSNEIIIIESNNNSYVLQRYYG